jgi:hypothetical protein
LNQHALMLFCANDVGPLKYLFALEEWFSNIDWIYTKNTESLFNGKNIVWVNDIQSASLVITGTSLGESPDKELLIRAQKHKIPSVSIVEHWSWYKKRFELDGKMILPDHIIVNDHYAREQAVSDGLPDDKIFVGGNPYLENLSKSELPRVDIELWQKKNNLKNGKIILFITEALKDSFLPDTEDSLGYDEFEVLNDIISILPVNFTLLIKIHPEEENEKYIRYQSDHIKVFERMDMEEMVQISHTIIGMASMLLIELAMYRDDIISYRPNARKEFIGEIIGATHNARTKTQLIKYFKDPPSSSSMPFREKFEGSGKCISQFLNSLI